MSFSFKTLTAAAALCVSGVAAQANVIPFDVLVTSSIDAFTQAPSAESAPYLNVTGSGTYDSGSLPDPILGGNWFTPFGNEFSMTLNFPSGAETFNSDDDVFLGFANVEYSVTEGILQVAFDVADDDLFTLAVENNIAAPNIVDFSVINVLQASGGNRALLEIEVQTAAPIPLPATAALMLGAFGLLGAAGRKRRQVTA